MNHDHLTRQMDLIPLSALGLPITIIGAGAVGSFTTLALAKMGFQNLTVYDPDTVSIENMNCQFYRWSDVDRKKVFTLQELVYQFTKVSINAKALLYDGSKFPGVVISAVDSMTARLGIWEAHQASAIQTLAVIDPRMGAETALLYVMNPMDMSDAETYKKTLYTDDDAVSEPCTRKSTMYAALCLSGLVAAQVKSLATGQKPTRITQWDIPKGHMMAWEKK